MGARLRRVLRVIVVAKNMQAGRAEAAARGLSLAQVRLVTSRHDLYKLQGVRDQPVVYVEGWDRGKQIPEKELIVQTLERTQGTVEEQLS